MQFIETSVFTKQIQALADDDSLRELQAALTRNPEAGAVIAGTGGLRKVRWAASGRGKRGGMRVIYYWIRPRSTTLMLLAYSKNVKDDLTAEQKKVLRAIVEEELK